MTGRALILAVVAAILLVSLSVPVRAWFTQRSAIAGLRADVEAARERVAALEIEKERWDDPAFVAAEARRRLQFVLPGEVGFVTLGGGGAVDSTTGVDGAQEPWFSSLWSSVRTADADPAADGAAAGRSKGDGSKGDGSKGDGSKADGSRDGRAGDPAQ